MGFDDLLDHTATIWRPTRSTGSLKQPVTTWAIVAAAVPCTVQRPRATFGDPGAGLTPIGERVIYCGPEIDLQARDLVELTSGPDVGTFEVDGPVTRPRGHHAEARCRHWAGTAPAVA